MGPPSTTSTPSARSAATRPSCSACMRATSGSSRDSQNQLRPGSTSERAPSSQQSARTPFHSSPGRRTSSVRSGLTSSSQPQSASQSREQRRGVVEGRLGTGREEALDLVLGRALVAHRACAPGLPSGGMARRSDRVGRRCASSQRFPRRRRTSVSIISSERRARPDDQPLPDADHGVARRVLPLTRVVVALDAGLVGVVRDVVVAVAGSARVWCLTQRVEAVRHDDRDRRSSRA